ncbi:Uu.00g020090.m01.CDS01 [Anthostomella pinea]|uniref:Uu.00g020090.m01.CDS01 n=1 Tax=Anthostomella pinea TaxID=933095 RepID=A0AAI8W0B8_9PEZI|nr:Uu.00g020090.m01.CDS01 [Anthostomella pinea]
MSSANPSAAASHDEPIVRHMGGSLFEVTLSRQNRHELFSEAIEQLSGNQEEAEIIMSNLQSWSPNLAESFHIRTPSLILDTPFRLICESDLGHVPFDSERVFRQYIAISYCWRHKDYAWPPDGSRPHEPWPFSKSFVEAILTQRGVITDEPGARNINYRREGIWVDQMCINQDDETENQQFIAMMDTIYKRCRKLLILLEDVTLTPDETRVLAKCDFHMLKDTVSWTPEEGDVPYLAAVCDKIESSRWWSRSWCWHELEINEQWSVLRHHIAHAALFIANTSTGGTFSVKYLTLMLLRSTPAVQAVATGPDRQRTGMERLRRDLRWTILDNKTSPYTDPGARGYGAVRSSFMARYYVISLCDITVPSDLISIVINLSRLAVYFTGRLHTSDEVFFVAAALSLAAGEKSPLYLMKQRILRINGRDSWLSRPLSDYDTNIPKFALGSIENIHEIKAEYIKLDLFFFETPIETMTTEDVAATYHILPETPIRTRPPQYRIQVRPEESTYGDELLDRPRRLFLAAACKNGLAYVCRLLGALERDVVQPSLNQRLFEPFTADESLRPAAQRLCDSLIPDSPSRESESAEETLLLFLTFLTDSRPMARLVISALSTRIRCNFRGDFAVVSGRILRDDIPGLDATKWRLAVPRDVADSPCAVSRVWILQPLEDSDTFRNDAGLWESTGGRWRLVGKALLLGEPQLVAGENAESKRVLTLRTRQVVTG